MEQEVWKDVVGYEGLYKISNTGNLASFRRSSNMGRILTKHISHNGYMRYSLSRGKNVNYFAHRLVAKAFIPNPENKPFINHKNCIKTDNRVENLEWVTSKENTNHALNSGVLMGCRGESNIQSKLTKENVINIYNSTKTLSQLSKKYNCTIGAMSNIRTGRSWSFLTGKKYEPKSRLYTIPCA